ncbi:MAG: bifunctional phosphoribosylaminoimidazolecarboxamide formyltransferase/IMP cyclohydrolase [Deferribacterota bacterium]|nr:bifunctional phosphoribosylaminoimidazolecarboxamide formyltransferase/IMP cyclohydrolase [Deferribacterota bacterium]
MKALKVKRALISVSDKSGIIDFAKYLSSNNVEIISTGGTAKLLEENSINTTKISDFTGSPEILDGRVKTLHPKIFAGILYKRENKKHIDDLKEFNAKNIDLVVVNLYPFSKDFLQEDNRKIEKDIEYIDIGGPTLVRAAAKNFKDVIVVIDPKDYPKVIEELDTNNDLSYNTRLLLAIKAFSFISYYDSIIAKYFSNAFDVLKLNTNIWQNINNKFPQYLTLPAKRLDILRYGENPHQEAALYENSSFVGNSGLHNLKQLHGKKLSYNNLVDIDAAINLANDFNGDNFCAIIKHTNPCGAAIGRTTLDAFNKAFEGDSLSAFGGIVCFNKTVDENVAEAMSKIFFEVIIAPNFSDKALQILQKKKNLRLIVNHSENANKTNGELEVKNVTGAYLLQDKNTQILDKNKLEFPTNRKATNDELDALIFAWKIVKHVKSNAITITDKNSLIGVGAGQMSRIDSLKIAINKASKDLNGTVMASDAFFPFRDCVDEAAKHGISAIIQPGGSIRDKESVEAANEHNIAMVFTRIRHFKH